MAGKGQPNTVLNANMDVLEFSEATDLVQAMEARGDFKFKGIFALYNMILDWTNKFPTNGVLPAEEQLARETKLPSDKLKFYLNELLGRGSTPTFYVYAIPAVEINPSGGGVSNFLVFCRPTKGDGPTARRYVQSYIDKNAETLGRWISSRPANQGNEYAEFLAQHIEKNRLTDTHAGTEIARFFYNDYDNTAELKKITYNLISRPVIQKLINTRKLLLLKTESGQSGVLPDFRGIYYNDGAEIEGRLKMLAVYIFRNVVRNAEAAQAVNNLKAKEVYQEVLDVLPDFNSLETGVKQAVTEIFLLSGTLEKIKKESHEKEKNDELEKILHEVVQFGRIMELSAIKASEDVRNSILSVKSILNADYPIRDRVSTFILHQDVIPAAIKNARELYDKTGNETEVLILQAMGIDKHLDPELRKLFDSLLQRVYFDQLPFFSKIWRMLFGRDDLKPEEQAKIKSDIAKKLADEKMKIRTEEARLEKKKLASERMKKSDTKSTPKTSGEKSSSSSSSSGEDSEGAPAISAPEPMTDEEKAEAANKEAQIKENLKKICDIIDSAWSAGQFPNRTHIIENLNSFDEDTLIFFLKKHARKEIFSFRIRHDKPEYVWPILITKNYLRRNGRKMLNQAIKDADEQRAAAMPNQEKFDVATSLEDFLSKLLSKPR